jgi:Zn-dependent protease
MNENEYVSQPYSGPPGEPDLPTESLNPVELVPVEVVGPPPPYRHRRWIVPLALFLATCASTFIVGGLVYSVCLMTILVCHEAGHFIQTRRYGVPASLPFFLPMPLPPLGTIGAVIAMDARIADRKALFDIGISGPLAGLIPTLVFCVLGLQPGWSKVEVKDPAMAAHSWEFGEPLVFKMMTRLTLGPVPEGSDVFLGPMAMAGWAGLLVTALNLFPIGQLDGGHILYALLRRRAHAIASVLLAAAVVATVALQLYGWSLMLALLVLMGPKHPPTSNDHARLGRGRIALGWLTLAFLPFGFTPNPIVAVPQSELEAPPAHQRRFQPPPSDEQRWVRQDGIPHPGSGQTVGRTEPSEARRAEPRCVACRSAACVACRHAAQPRVGMDDAMAASMLRTTLRVVSTCHRNAEIILRPILTA